MEWLWAQFRLGGLASAAGHLALIVFAQFGLSFLFSPPEVTARIIPVEVVTIDDVTRPPEAATPEPKPEPQRTAAPQPPPSPPQPVPEPPRPPEPQQLAKAEPAPPPPPLVKPAPPKEKTPEPKPEPAPPIAKAQPRAKPKPPAPVRSFDNVLKDLAAEQMPFKTTERAPRPETTPKQGKEAPQQSQVAERATIAELDRLRHIIREQIGRCWNPPVGAREAENLVVTVFIRVDPKGMVREATIVDAPMMGLDRNFQAAAEAARRAVLNVNCQPLQLPADKYEIWKEIRFNFDPSQMLNLS
jgi:outer membrane biosynthesis protein TonB